MSTFSAELYAYLFHLKPRATNIAFITYFANPYKVLDLSIRFSPLLLLTGLRISHLEALIHPFRPPFFGKVRFTRRRPLPFEALRLECRQCKQIDGTEDSPCDLDAFPRNHDSGTKPLQPVEEARYAPGAPLEQKSEQSSTLNSPTMPPHESPTTRSPAPCYSSVSTYAPARNFRPESPWKVVSQSIEPPSPSLFEYHDDNLEGTRNYRPESPLQVVSRSIEPPSLSLFDYDENLEGTRALFPIQFQQSDKFDIDQASNDDDLSTGTESPTGLVALTPAQSQSPSSYDADVDIDSDEALADMGATSPSPGTIKVTDNGNDSAVERGAHCEGKEDPNDSEYIRWMRKKLVYVAPSVPVDSASRYFWGRIDNFQVPLE